MGQAIDDEASSLAGSDREQLIGTVVAGKYELQGYVGRGATGAVYRARHRVLEKSVALKILDAELARNDEVVELFKREAKAASRIDHANSVRILDFGENESGLLYIVMEFVEGPDLLQVLDEQFPFAEPRVIDMMSQLLLALAAAHDLGVIHRDLKPENILVLRSTDDEGSPVDLIKVCDFGVAQLSTAAALRAPAERRKSAPPPLVVDIETLVGTPEYMSPEQVRNEPLDARSDVYSAGVVLFHLLTGRLPFTAETAEAVAMMQCTTPTPPPSWFARVSPQLEAICLKAMSKEPDDRYPSARHMRAALRSVRPSVVKTPALRDWPPPGDPDAAGPDTMDPPAARAVPARQPRNQRAIAIAVLLLPPMVVAAHLWSQTSEPVALPGPPTAALSSPARTGLTNRTARLDDARPALVAADETASRSLTPVVAPQLLAADSPEPSAAITSAPAPRVAVRAPRPRALTEQHATRAPRTDREVLVDRAVPAVAEASLPTTAELEPGVPATQEAATDTADDPPSEQALAQTLLAGESADEPPVQTVEPARAPTSAKFAATGVERPSPRVRSFEVVTRIEEVTVRGSLAKSVVQRAIDRLRTPLSACYTRSAQAAGRDGFAPIRVEVELDERGRARRARAGGAALPGLDSCVNAVVAKLSTAQPPDTGTVNASWRVDFAR